jgi:hypothetical protein
MPQEPTTARTLPSAHETTDPDALGLDAGFAAVFGPGRGRGREDYPLTRAQRLSRLATKLWRAFAEGEGPVPVDDIAASFGLEFIDGLPVCRATTAGPGEDGGEGTEVYEPEGILLTVAETGNEDAVLGAVLIATGANAIHALRCADPVVRLVEL